MLCTRLGGEDDGSKKTNLLTRGAYVLVGEIHAQQRDKNKAGDDNREHRVVVDKGGRQGIPDALTLSRTE